MKKQYDGWCLGRFTKGGKMEWLIYSICWHRVAVFSSYAPSDILYIKAQGWLPRKVKLVEVK